MKVSVIVNPRAGSAKMDIIEGKIADALFRCTLRFHFCGDRNSLDEFVASEIKSNTDAFLICGGDGTINSTLQFLMKNKIKNKELPPICLVSSGTANDLAHEMELSHRIDEAARLILEGKEKRIDLIEVESKNEKKYMLTNGGMGIPAIAADQANHFRSLVEMFVQSEQLPKVGRKLGRLLHGSIKKAGTLIYSSTLLNTLKNWDSRNWELEVAIPGRATFMTQAPFLLVNNQPMIGKNFLTSPYTSHNDGLINLLLIESKTLLSQLEKIARVLTGSLRENSQVKSFEVSEFKIRTKNQNRKITFFGDGEILFRDVEEVNVRCLRRSIGIMARE